MVQNAFSGENWKILDPELMVYVQFRPQKRKMPSRALSVSQSSLYTSTYFTLPYATSCGAVEVKRVLGSNIGPRKI